MTSPTDPDDMLAGWQQQIQAKMQQAERLREAATSVRTSSSSRDGAITTTVDHSGNLIDLQLTDAALRQRPDEVSASILSTLRSAQSQLGEQMREVMEPVVGSDTETMEAVMSGFRERFPQPEETAEDGRPGSRGGDDDDDDEPGSWMDDGRGR